MTPVETVTAFYNAFKARDGERMAELYDDRVVFSDPVFPTLRGEEARAMWRMLCARARDLTVAFSVSSAAHGSVQVHWEARYTFAATGRRVHNRVTADLTVRNGRITSHTDQFSFWKWASQALGLAGVILGWAPLLRSKVRRQASRALAHFRNGQA